MALFSINKDMTNEEIYNKAIKLYQRKQVSGGWFITGYKCPYCYKHYFSLRKEFYSHVKECNGPSTVRNLED